MCRPQIVGLAVSHLFLCFFISLYMISAWNHFSWEFGKSLCKLGSYVIYMNMFSCAAIITFWNLRRCAPRKCCANHLSSSTVLLSFFMGAILAAPSLLSREVRYSANGYACVDNYHYNEQVNPSEKARQREMAVMFTRIVLGQLLPLVVIILNRCIQRRTNIHSERLESLFIRPVTIAHFLCWTPVLWLTIPQVKLRVKSDFLKFALPCATALSIFNSCIFPIICIWRRKRHRNQRSPTDSWAAPTEGVSSLKTKEEHSLCQDGPR
ncbi:chemerin-like receptor 2 [Aplochiton taeniatus]